MDFPSISMDFPWYFMDFKWFLRPFFHRSSVDPTGFRLDRQLLLRSPRGGPGALRSARLPEPRAAQGALGRAQRGARGRRRGGEEGGEQRPKRS